MKVPKLQVAAPSSAPAALHQSNLHSSEPLDSICSAGLLILMLPYPILVSQSHKWQR